jgi:hypothetical protein
MRTPVFEFAMARNPQTISPQVEAIFAIRLEQNLQSASHYFADVPRLSFGRIRVVLQNRSSSFSEAVTLRGLRSEFAAQIALHDEFHRERHRQSAEHMAEAFGELDPGPISDDERVRLWDNLAHSLWVMPDEDIVEVTRTILVADHFRLVAGPILRNGPPTDEEDILAIRRALQARVVMPLGVDNRVEGGESERLTAIQARLLRAAHAGIMDRAKLSMLTAFKARLSAAVGAMRPATPAPPAFGLARPTGLSETSSTQPRLTINALSLPRPLDLPISIAEFAAPEADADTVLIALDDEVDSLEADLGDRDDDAPEDEQIFFLHGAEIVVRERVPPGAFMVSAEEVEGGFHLHLTYFHDKRAPEMGRITGRIEAAMGVATISADPLVSGREGYQHYRLTTQPLRGARFEVTLNVADVSANQTAEIAGLVIREVGAHSAVVPWAGPQDLVADPPPLFGVNKVGVIDFHRVEQELYCFEASEPSHIENLMAREHKERMTRSFTLNEVESERIRESGFERQDDTQTADRFEQQSTVEEVLQEEASRNINVNAGVSGGFGNSVQVFANTAVTFANSTSREQSRSDALTFAREITSRVAQKITSKTTERRRALVRREFEDVSRHGFDNRAGDQPVVSIYRFLDKIYRNHLVNYGRRCVVEWMIPDPSRNYIRAQELSAPEDDFNRRPPKKPRRLGLRKPSDVTPRNYRRFAKAYGIDDLPAPPPFIMFISRSFAENDPPAAPPEEGEEAFDPGPQAVSYEIEIPDDYLATHYSVTHQSHSPQGSGGGGTAGMQKFDAPLSFSVPYQALDDFPMIATVTIRLVIRRVVQRDWQYQVFSRIMEAYREKKAEYDAAREAYEDESRRADLNPRFKEDIIQRELRRVALYMIQKPHGTDVTHDHYLPAQKGELHTLNLTSTLDRHAALVRFFEQAFEWDLMAYLLYPYFYADEKTWSVRLAMEETRNRDFAAFLTSGMARLVVPIRPGFEDAVTHYLQTGETWFGRGVVMDVDNDLYLSIAEEMASGTEETEILETWLTAIPTNLNILQENAGAIVGDGLPCLDEEQGPIGTGSSVLAPIIATPTNDN